MKDVTSLFHADLHSMLSLSLCIPCTSYTKAVVELFCELFGYGTLCIKERMSVREGKASVSRKWVCCKRTKFVSVD